MIRFVVFTAAALLTFPAWADREHRSNPTATLQQISAESMTRKINDLGYDVRRLELEDGIFKAHLVDRQSGGAVRAIFHGSTGELLRAELHD